MGLESMRGGYGRCPPLLVGGLLVVCLILTCSWWSLSSQNYELLKQVDEIGEQLKRCAEDRDQHVQLYSSVESRIKGREEELAQLRVRLEQQEINADESKKQLEEKDATIKRMTKELESQKSSFTMCNTELESLKKVDQSKDEMIASLKVEKEGLLSQREDRKKEMEKIKAELKKAMTDLSNVKANSPANNAKIQQPPAAWWSSNKTPSTPLLNLELHNRGMHGLHFHAEPILPRDPPNAQRPAPRFSVMQLTSKGKPSDAGAKSNVAAKPADLNADEKDEDNAKERDDTNMNEPADAEDERFDKNNDDNDGNNIPEENAQEDSVDQMAHAIQEDVIDGQAAAPPPSKGV